MKENYRPWNIKVGDFPQVGSRQEQLEFLIGFAILAPSGHNSQPWNFSVSNNIVSLWVNKERSLAQSDPERRQLLIAMGCALENLLLAADYYGFKTEVRYFPHANHDCVATVFFEKSVADIDHSENHLIFQIPKRRTNRNKYSNKTLPREFLDAIQVVDLNLNVTIISEEATKIAVADLALVAQIETMENDSFREELSGYIRHNFTNHKTGMPGFTLDIPMPVSFIASRLIKKINLSKMTRKKDEALLKQHTPHFVIISVAKDDEVHRVKAGQLFERVWLLAEKEGVSCAPLAASVQTSDYYKHLQKILGLEYRPEVFFRIGYCGKVTRHSPRLQVNEVII